MGIFTRSGECSATELEQTLEWWLAILPGLLFMVGLLGFAIPAFSGVRNLFFVAALVLVGVRGIYRVAKGAKR